MSINFSISKRKLCFPFMVALLALSFFDLNLPFFGSMSVFLVIILGLLFWRWGKPVLEYKYYMEIIFLLFFFSTYVVFRSVSTNIDYMLIYSKVVLSVISSFYITSVLIRGFSVEYYIRVFYITFFLQSLSPYLFLYSSDYRDFVSALQYFDPVRNYEQKGVMAVRKSFLSGSGGYFGMAVALGLGLLISSWMYVKEGVGSIYFLFYFLLLSVATVIAARTGILFVFISLLVLFFSLRAKSRIIIFVSLSAIALFFIVSIEEIYRFVSEYKVLSWAFEPLINFYTDGSLGSQSTGVLYNMFFIPDIDTILWGDGLYYEIGGGYYGGSDIGYIRQILFGGFLIVVFSVIYLFFALRYGSKAIIFSVSISLLLVHFKGGVLLATPSTMAILSSFSAYLYHRHKFGG
jgi:hypothetical protein